MTVRAIIVDDEPLARQRIRDLLAGEDVAVLAECEDALQALQAIQDQRPDLLFLDVQMPGADGFELLRMLEAPRPMIIFTTAFDTYAVRAFDEQAVDYLLKPIDAARFRESLARAVARTQHDWSERLGKLIERLDRHPQLLRRLVVKTPGRVFFVDVRDVTFFEAAANYVRVHTGTETHLVRMTMHALEERLDPRAFARIHRSTIVNVARVAELQTSVRGDYDVVMKNGTRLPMQRAYHDRLREALGEF